MSSYVNVNEPFITGGKQMLQIVLRYFNRDEISGFVHCIHENQTVFKNWSHQVFFKKCNAGTMYR